MKLSAQLYAVVKYLELKIQDFEEFLIMVFVLFVDKIEDFLEISFKKENIAVGNAVFMLLGLVGYVAVTFGFSAQILMVFSDASNYEWIVIRFTVFPKSIEGF